MEPKGSFDAVQGEVEDVVVAQHARFRSLPVLTHNGARDKEWHALLTEPSINCH
jgi:predicted nucleic acid-binding protein